MPDESPINLIMKATRLIAEALRLLESATTTAPTDASTDTTNVSTGVGSQELPNLDFSFLDTQLNKVDWGFDYQKRLSKAFDSWNTHENRFVEADSRRLLITVRDLLAIGEDELRAQPYVGRETIIRINVILGKHGMKLNV